MQHNLTKLRKQKGLTQAQLADRLNISRQSISKWEKGINYPDIDNLILLSDIYSVSVDFLIKKGGRK